MRYKVQHHFPASGMAEDPGVIVEYDGTDLDQLSTAIEDSLFNDEGRPFHVGYQVIITRMPDA